MSRLYGLGFFLFCAVLMLGSSAQEVYAQISPLSEQCGVCSQNDNDKQGRCQGFIRACRGMGGLQHKTNNQTFVQEYACSFDRLTGDPQQCPQNGCPTGTFPDPADGSCVDMVRPAPNLRCYIGGTWMTQVPVAECSSPTASAVVVDVSPLAPCFGGDNTGGLPSGGSNEEVIYTTIEKCLENHSQRKNGVSWAPAVILPVPPCDTNTCDYIAYSTFCRSAGGGVVNGASSTEYVCLTPFLAPYTTAPHILQTMTKLAQSEFGNNRCAAYNKLGMVPATYKSYCEQAGGLYDGSSCITQTPTQCPTPQGPGQSGGADKDGGGTTEPSGGGDTTDPPGGSGTTCAGNMFCNPLKVGSIEQLVLTVIDVVLVFLLPVIILYIMYAGYLFVTAQGNPGELTAAKKALLTALIGGVIILGARAILDVVKGTLESIVG